MRLVAASRWLEFRTRSNGLLPELVPCGLFAQAAAERLSEKHEEERANLEERLRFGLRKRETLAARDFANLDQRYKNIKVLDAPCPPAPKPLRASAPLHRGRLRSAAG